MKRLGMILSVVLLVTALAPARDPKAKASAEPALKVRCQESGPFKVRSYLVYDEASKEAVIIDAGSAVDWLVAAVEEEDLDLKLILLTHAHQDHVAGLPLLRERFPKVKLAYSRLEFEDRGKFQDWRTLFDSKSVELWKSDPRMLELMDFDYGRLPAPDIEPADGQTFPLGAWAVKVILTPGHSRGGLTFAAGQALFPGDLLLYHATGDMSYPLCSRSEIVTSIRKLYEGFGDETLLYSGHGESSKIGYEKANNRNVTASEVKWLP